MISLLKWKIPLPWAVLILFYSLICLSVPDICKAQTKQIKESPWHISAKSLTYDNKKKLYIAEKDVLITGGETRIEADYAEFSKLTQDAFVRGNVILSSGEDVISCDAFKMNLATETGTINKGTVFIKRENFYLSGEDIRKTGKATYKMKQGTLTSCSGEDPDWKISGDKIDVRVEGYGTARNVVFWAKKVPTAYLPYLFFPVKTKRQTGLLTPMASFSKRKGVQYEQPLFVAISKNMDATLYTDYMSKRGLKTGGEFRYIPDNKSKGTVFLDYLQDNEIDDGTEKTKDFSFSGTTQRTNADRYWFRMKHDHRLPQGINAKLDIDMVSDPDYLLEFGKGYSGFGKTNQYFEDEFGRSLDGDDVTLRKNQLYLSKRWSNYLFATDVLWYDNIVTKRNNQADTTLQTLPALQFNAFKQQIVASGLYYTFNSEYKSFYRKDTTTSLIRGHRTDLYPKIYLPRRISKSFRFEPYIGFRGTSWYTDDFTSSDGKSEKLRTRLMGDTGAQLSTKLIKVFNTDNKFAEKIKHELIPKLAYSFIPETDQDNLPEFDSLDRIAEQNLLTWSLTNYLISRKKRSKSSKGPKAYTYNDFAYVHLSQSFDINKQKDNDPEPFSDFVFTGRLYPNNSFAINTDFSYSFYDDQFSKYNIGGSIKDKRGDMLISEYRYNRDNFETLYSEINVVLKTQNEGLNKDRTSQIFLSDSSQYHPNELEPELSVNYSIEKNLRDDEILETQAGLKWQKECWSVELSRTETKGDVSVGFLINLNNLGSF